MELFNQAKKKKNIDKRDADFEAAKLEKNPEEYTFQPNASKRFMSPEA
jgi:hypothetical protein